MTWTPSERPARRSAATTWPSRAGVASGKPSACCSPPATARWGTDVRDQPPQGAGGQRPQRLREQLRALPTDQLLARCARLRSHPTQPIEHRATIVGLRRTAQRALALQAEVDELHDELDTLVGRLAPRLFTEPGVGVICAAQLLTAWSHAGRLRSEAAFAMLGGAAPVEASSGKVVRHRLNRSGDRQLNRALHTSCCRA